MTPDAGILTGPEIEKQISMGRIVIDPFNPKHVTCGSVDLTLGNRVTLYTGTFGDSKKEPCVDGRTFGPIASVVKKNPELIWDSRAPWPTETRVIDPEIGWVVKPGICYLMHTAEQVWTDHYIPIIDGKALALDTEVPTPTGWTTMGALKPGDFVYGSSGEPVRVIRATPAYLQERCLAVEFRNGERIVADAAHEWFVLPVDAKAGIRSTEQLRSRTTGRASAIFRVPCGYVVGAEQELPIAPYTLGVWLGDRTSATADVTIRHGDEQICDELAAEGYAAELRPSEEHGASRYKVGSKARLRGDHGMYAANDSLHSRLKAAGVLGDKHIPAIYLRASRQQRMALLQGLMDTDGTVHRDDQASLTFTNERLIHDAEELLRSLGVITYFDSRPAKISGKPTGGTAYRLTWRALPEHFRLDRQKRKVRATDEWIRAARNPQHSIMRVLPVDSVPVRCITVESPDGLFLASRSFIPTHNSSIGRAFILVHYTAGYGDPGFSGHYTLEVTSQIPIRLYPGMKICQVRFHTMVGEPRLYNGHYTGQNAQGAVGTRLHESAYVRRARPVTDNRDLQAELLDALDT